MVTGSTSRGMPLSGLRVIDAATLFAGPLAATLLGDFGAEVIKVEHPVAGDPARTHGYTKNGVGLWWKMLGRNKLPITLNLSHQEGADLLCDLVRNADVLIENFRPGTLERWGLSYERLSASNRGLILARVTGFGQTGPYSQRAGFGTLAEAMSGFAYATGEPDGHPTLPPFGLADGTAALATAYAVVVALQERHRSGMGQVIDMAITDPIMTVIGAAPTVYDQLGIIQERTGNRTRNSAPRNTYRTADGHWVAVSASATSIAERIMRLVGCAELIDEPWFATGSGRADHVDEIDDAVARWIAQRNRADVIDAFGKAEAAIAPVYSAADIVADPHFAARESILTVDDDELGAVKMQNVMFRLDRTPGRIRWTGRPKGAANEHIYSAMGLSQETIDALRGQGTI